MPADNAVRREQVGPLPRTPLPDGPLRTAKACSSKRFTVLDRSAHVQGVRGAVFCAEATDADRDLDFFTDGVTLVDAELFFRVPRVRLEQDAAADVNAVDDAGADAVGVGFLLVLRTPADDPAEDEPVVIPAACSFSSTVCCGRFRSG